MAAFDPEQLVDVQKADFRFKGRIISLHS